MAMWKLIIFLFLIFCAANCVPWYQRDIEGIYLGKSAVLLAALEQVLKEKEYENLFVTMPESPSWASIIASYSRYEETLRKDLHINIYIKDNDGRGQSEFHISVRALGWETQTMEAVDKAFEDFVERITSRFEEPKFKITKLS